MDVTRTKKKTPKNENSLVYEIPCEHCPKVYVGETHLGLEKRLYGHKRDLARSEISNALVKHREATSHRPDLANALAFAHANAQGKCAHWSEKNFNIQNSSHRVSKFLFHSLSKEFT